MYARTLLHRTLGKHCTGIHATRLCTCTFAVQSLLDRAKAAVTSSGRGL